MSSGASSIAPSTSSARRSQQSGRPDPSEPLYQVKLLQALRSGDPALIHPFLAEIGKDKRNSTDEKGVDTGAAALHLAIRCAPCATVLLLLSHRAISPNGVHPPGSRTSALHLAASIGRTDVVNLLLEQPGIDDTVKDVNGKTCREVAKTKDVVCAIDDSRAFLNASFRSLLRTYIQSPLSTDPDAALVSLVESPRVRYVDLQYLDNETGRSLLHEAARRKDLRLIELAVRGGADIFVRDRRGKTPHESLPKDDRARVFLRQFANQDKTLIDGPTQDLPTLKGYLQKYTNVAKGYSTRWVVLKAGVLSYYRHQEDETIASRGSISMKSAYIKLPTSQDKLRFEVYTPPSRGHQTPGVQKWYLKANHHVEAHRWTQAIAQSIEYFRKEGPEKSMGDSFSGSAKMSPSHRGSISVGRASSILSWGRLGQSEGSFVNIPGEEEATPDLNDHSDREDNSRHGSLETFEDATDIDEDSNPPHENDFELQGNSLAAQMELISNLILQLPLPLNPSADGQDVQSALRESLDSTQHMFVEYVDMARRRESWWKSRVKSANEKQKAWEESLQIVVKEGEQLERELRDRSRRRGSRFFDYSATESGFSTLKTMPAGLRLAATPVTEEKAEEKSQNQNGNVAISVADASLEGAPAPLQPVQSPGFTTTDVDTDDEDEFFDAIEFNTLPNVKVNESIVSPSHTNLSIPAAFEIKQFVGYKTLRSRLAISDDDRPTISLWSVLKNSIGKDLTKISFPVAFNEPTSMLQRMAEDMEFSECLDIAARERDPHMRIAYVAAFAMSNYSSTIGRIAKPFNPMLNETFEYVRFDKEYRYVSEQVSHHPPISACWAESPFWHYYGEVDAQNKFMGKSFEIRPTGVAHADLLISEERGPGYPKAAGPFGEGKVVEHYSWKKVTTSVSGFIFGSPTIDHYGDMEIINHRTGDTCTLTFKPRGWRGKDAFEISGSVKDSSGNITYEIAGRWNSQLLARARGVGTGFLHPDTTISGPTSPSSPQEYICLWRNSEKPRAPFNLTPFAITLNDCPRHDLRPYLAPTDCRLRVDQRAFELGKYELADTLKYRQEEKQRSIRRAREEGRLPKHRPRWFTATVDQDTGERLWAPSRTDDGSLEYWVERAHVWREGGCDKRPWKDTDNIFIEEPEELKETLERL